MSFPTNAPRCLSNSKDAKSTKRRAKAWNFHLKISGGRFRDIGRVCVFFLEGGMRWEFWGEVSGFMSSPYQPSQAWGSLILTGASLSWVAYLQWYFCIVAALTAMCCPVGPVIRVPQRIKQLLWVSWTLWTYPNTPTFTKSLRNWDLNLSPGWTLLFPTSFSPKFPRGSTIPQISPFRCLRFLYSFAFLDQSLH